MGLLNGRIMAGIVLPTIVLSGLLLLGSLPLPAAGAAQRATASPKPAAAGSLLVVAVEGDAQLRGQLLAAGAALMAGDELRAGQAGHVRLKLTDGSTIAFWGPGSLVLDRIRLLPSARGVDASLRLENGRIEATVREPRHGETRVEVRTPISVALTRGALFRVTAAQNQSMTCEVAEGSVQVTDSANLGSVAVPGGRGTRVLAGRPPMQPVALLAPPHLWTGIQLVEQKRAEISFTPLPRASAYRMIVSPGADLDRHLVEDVFDVPRLRISGLADGDYFVRVRAIDEFGLEGTDVIVRMRILVRAEPRNLVVPAERADQPPAQPRREREPGPVTTVPPGKAECLVEGERGLCAVYAPAGARPR